MGPGLSSQTAPAQGGLGFGSAQLWLQRLSMLTPVSLLLPQPMKALGRGLATAQRLAQQTSAVTMYIGAHLPNLIQQNALPTRLSASLTGTAGASTTPTQFLCTGSKQHRSLAAGKQLTLQPISSAQGRLSSSDFKTLALKMPRRGRGRLTGKDQRLQADAETASQAASGLGGGQDAAACCGWTKGCKQHKTEPVRQLGTCRQPRVITVSRRRVVATGASRPARYMKASRCSENFWHSGQAAHQCLSWPSRGLVRLCPQHGSCTPSQAGMQKGSSCCQAGHAEAATGSSGTSVPTVEHSLGDHIHLCLGEAALEGADKDLVLKGMRGQYDVLHGRVQCLQKVHALSAAEMSHCVFASKCSSHAQLPEVCPKPVSLPPYSKSMPSKETQNSKQVCRSASYLVGAMGEYSRRPPDLSLMAVMRTVVATLMPTRLCSCSNVQICPGTTCIGMHAMAGSCTAHSSCQLG